MAVVADTGPGVPDRVRTSVGILTVVVAAAGAFGLIPTVVSLVVAVVVVVTIGIAHGALDHLVAERIDRDPASRRVFVARYVAAMAAVGIVWSVAPLVALVGFLIMSVHHFGQSDLARLRVGPAAARLPLWWSRGALIVGVPLVAHLEEVAPTVSTLTGVDVEDWLSSGLLRWWIVAAIVAVHVGVVVVVLRDRRERRAEVAVASVLAALFVATDPLLGFSVYFGLWHSLGHVYVLADRLDVGDRPLRRVGRAALPLTVVSLAGLAAMVIGLVVAGRDDLIVAATVIAVSALTLPHMVVVERLWRSDVTSPSRIGPGLESAQTRR